jgi:hypothetical protein
MAEQVVVYVCDRRLCQALLGKDGELFSEMWDEVASETLTTLTGSTRVTIRFCASGVVKQGVTVMKGGRLVFQPEVP